MSHNNGIITAPVNQRDVQNVLGISSSVDEWSELCTHANIVKWAMYKPVRQDSEGNYNSQFDKTNNRWKNDATWWLGDKTGQRWGMAFGIYGGIGSISSRTVDGKVYREPTSGFFYSLMRNNLRWTYYKPNGVANGAPYRIGDFAGYNHKSPCPLPYTYTKTQYVSGATSTMATYTLDCGIRNPNEEVVGGLTLINMTTTGGYQQLYPNLGKLYVGTLWYNSDMTDCFWQCSSTKLEELYGLDAENRAKALRISLTNTDFSNQYNKSHKDWSTRAFLCSKSLGYCETLVDSQGHIIIACDESATTCTFAVAGQMIISQFSATKANNVLNISVVVTNNSGSAKTATTPKVEILTGGTSIVQYSHTWSNQTLQHGESATFHYQWSGVLDTNLDAKFTCSYSGGSLNQTVHVNVK